jgi:hypothetical protein
MVVARAYADRKRRGICTDCGLRPAWRKTTRCALCMLDTRERVGGRVPTASATYWRAREHRWRTQHIQIGDRFFNCMDYIAAWHAQDGKCGLCTKPLPVQQWHDEVGTGRGISPDHDHHSHQFRALVCTACNIRISTLNLSWALQVVEYLRCHQTVAPVRLL